MLSACRHIASLIDEQVQNVINETETTHRSPSPSLLADRPSRTVYVWLQYGQPSSGAVCRLRLLGPAAGCPVRIAVSRVTMSTAAVALQSHWSCLHPL